jgi:hypothetical protein
MKARKRGAEAKAAHAGAVAGLDHWKLEDAKARFSEVVRRAGTAGRSW